MFSIKTSPVEGVPIIPGGSIWTGHLSLMREPDFQKALYAFAVEYADSQGRCTFYMGPTTPALSVTRDADVEHLLKQSVGRQLFPLMKPHWDRFFGSRNIGILPAGKEWKQQRAAIVKALHGKAFQQHNQAAIQKATQVLVDRLADVDSVEDMCVILRMLAFDSFGQAALHTDFGCCRQLQASKIMNAFEFLSSDMMRRLEQDIWKPDSHLYRLPTAANRRHAEENTFVRNYIAELIRERRRVMKQQSAENGEQEGEKNDEIPQDLLTGMLEAAADDNGSDGVSEQTLSDTFVSLLFAGYETTSVALTYCLYVISQHPDVEQQCLKEISAAKSSPSAGTEDDDYTYLKAVIQETLRLYPPAISTTRSLEREVTLEAVLGDSDDDSVADEKTRTTITIPKGTYLYFPIWTIQRDPRNFTDPLEFRPERWLKEKNSNAAAFVAFSAGARSCAGQRFAMQEMVIVLSMLLERFHFETPADYQLTPHREGFVQSPKGGLPLKIVKR